MLPDQRAVTAAPIVRLFLATGLALVLVVCALPSPARADAQGPYDLSGQAMSSALRIGDTHWGGRPCRGQIKLSWVDNPDTEVNAVSRWTSTKPSSTNCSIAFNTNAQWNDAKFCTIVVHELGHLSGHPHSSDLYDLMSAYYTVPFTPCASAGLRHSGTAALARDAGAPGEGTVVMPRAASSLVTRAPSAVEALAMSMF